jgi:N-methylhydantoinase B/oxoprolinase/acetone carboxylase alpha subunit
VRPGDRILLGTPGGGGYGSFVRREHAARERDRAQGYTPGD